MLFLQVNLFTATLQQPNILTLQTKPAVTLMKEQNGNNNNRPASLLTPENLMAVWWGFHALFCIHATHPRADIFTLRAGEREKLNDMWVIWKIWIYVTKWSFSCPYLSVCSAEALAFRGVLCRERDELFSEWYFKRSIFHTINLSNCDISRSRKKCGWDRHETPLKWSRDEKTTKTKQNWEAVVCKCHLLVFGSSEYNIYLEG